MLRCSFCHKSQDAVAKLISSPSDYPRAYICDECVADCNSILEDDRPATPQTSAANPPTHPHRAPPEPPPQNNPPSRRKQKLSSTSTSLGRSRPRRSRRPPFTTITS